MENGNWRELFSRKRTSPWRPRGLARRRMSSPAGAWRRTASSSCSVRARTPGVSALVRRARVLLPRCSGPPWHAPVQGRRALPASCSSGRPGARSPPHRCGGAAQPAGACRTRAPPSRFDRSGATMRPPCACTLYPPACRQVDRRGGEPAKLARAGAPPKRGSCIGPCARPTPHQPHAPAFVHHPVVLSPAFHASGYSSSEALVIKR
jgi:hypothetical protein